jgi:hypothetical protein
MTDPIAKTKRRHLCWYCAKDMGEWDRRYCDPSDTCGERECERAARDAAIAERHEAHEKLDRDMGWR